MKGGKPQGRKSFTKIKNFTEKDQVRIKYSLLGKEKKLMLSVYIGEDVYNQLTDGREYKKINTTYIPGDMVVISPTNDNKGLTHRYNGSGMFKTTCVRISLGKFKGLKLSKRDFTNRVVEYSIIQTGNEKELKIDISSNVNKKPEKERYSSQVFSPLGKVYGPSEETVLTNTKADKKPDKSTYIPRMDHKLDEIQEKQEYIAKQVKDFNNTNHDISYRLSLLLQELEKNKEKDDHNRPDIDRRIAFLEARFSSVELRLDHLNNKKSLFERIFGNNIKKY